jgi:hypothetical protein
VRVRVRVRALTSHRHLHGASGQLAAGVGSASSGVGVAVGGVWVTSEATALINATVTAVAGVQVSVWRKRSGATDFWRADADFLWLGRCAMA